MSVFDSRQGKPLWPTLKGIRIDDQTAGIIRQTFSGCTYWTIGQQLSSVMYGMSTNQLALNFEVAKYVERLSGSSGPLYIGVSLLQYVKDDDVCGIVPHLYAQYPHVLAFHSTAVEKAMCETYVKLVRCVYGDYVDQKDVAQFIRLCYDVHGCL